VISAQCLECYIFEMILSAGKRRE